MSAKASWLEFNTFAAAASFDRYPLWNSIHKFIDPIACISFGFSIVHELQERKTEDKCEEYPPWYPPF